MGTNQLEERMLEESLSTLQNRESDDLSPAQGVILLDGWLQALQGDPNLEQLTGQLNELREALQQTQPDDSYVRDLLSGLADKAQAVAEDTNAEGTWTGGLESLSKILRRLATES